MLLLSVLCGNVFAGEPNEVRSNEYPTARVFSMGSMIGAQGRIRKYARAGSMPQAFADCVSQLQPEEFDEIWQALIREILTIDELRSADKYWSSSTGKRKIQAMMVATYGLYGETPPGPAPSPLSDLDNAAFDQFKTTQAGAKLAAALDNKNPGMNQVLQNRVNQLFDHCLASTRKP